MTTQSEEERRKQIEDIQRRVQEAIRPSATVTQTPTAVPGPGPTVSDEDRIADIKRRVEAAIGTPEQDDKSLLRRIAGGVAAPFTTPFRTPLQQEPQSLLQRAGRAMEPLDVLGELTFQALRGPLSGGSTIQGSLLRPQELSREALQSFQQRPLPQQLAIGLLDPTIFATRAIPLGIKGLRGAEVPPFLAGKRMARDIVRPRQLALPPGRTPAIAVTPSRQTVPARAIPPGRNITVTDLGLREDLPVVNPPLRMVSPTRQVLGNAPPPPQPPLPLPSTVSRTTYTGTGAAEAQRLVGAATAQETRIAAARLSGEASTPVRRPGEAVGSGSGTPIPRRTDVAVGDDLGIPTHELTPSAPFRKAEAAGNVVGIELEEFSINGARLQRGLTFDEENMRPLFEALHGERSVEELTPQMRSIFDEARRMLAIEEEEMLAFFQTAKKQGIDKFVSFDVDNMVSRFMAHPDYFPRGWKQVREPGVPGRGKIARTAAPLRTRVDATFSQLLDSGQEPLSWNPLEMVARRRITGVNFREQAKLVVGLKKRGLVEPANVAPEGWRVPKVGPVFEGRPLPNGGMTRQLFTPVKIAGELENLYGRQLEFIVRGKNILPEVRRWTNRFKRGKLFGSLFQHIDFLTRLLGPIFAPSSIARGVPLKAPSLAFRLVKNSILESSRTALRRDLLDPKPLFKDFAISNRMLIEEGWGVHGDISLIQREGVSFVEEAIRERGLVGKPLEAAQKMSRFFESGLFKGVYREAQRFSLENFIIPMLRRQNPNAGPREIAARAGEIVNIQFSTLGNWQTVLKDSPHLKEFFYNMAFSFNESESLIRQALGTIKGPNKRLWIENHIGMFFGIATIANLINFTATGKPLPIGSYNPIDFDDPYAMMKFGYNGRFLAPQAPGLQAKDGAPVYLDLVGQMDTVFQWAADPRDAAAARVNVVPRAARNQYVGETFFGERLDNPAIRAVAAASDIFAPIPVTAGLSAAQAAIPALEGIVPAGEGRLPPLAQAIQAVGLNLRGGVLIDQFPKAQEYFDLETPKARRAFRKANPEAEAVLFIEGRFSSLISIRGKAMVQTLMRRFNISPRNVKHYEKVFGSNRLPR